LFIQWVQKMGLDKIFATPWQSHSPLDTPCGLIDPVFATAVLEEVAEDIQSRYGMLDIAWGEVVRLRVGNQDLPASGTGSIFGSFQVLDIIPVDEKNFQATGGNSFMMAIEFTNPIRAEALTIYGNATQPHSPHVADQLSLYIRGQMRPVWRTQAAIADRLMLREILDLSSGLFMQVNG
jgi:acyl-homoserine-lactone acylase